MNEQISLQDFKNNRISSSDEFLHKTRIFAQYAFHLPINRMNQFPIPSIKDWTDKHPSLLRMGLLL